MITLQVADTGCANEGRVLGALDAFGDGDKAKAFNEIDQVAQKTPPLAARRQISNIGPVDLDRIHRQMLKMTQRGVAGSEIVERHPAAEVVQGVDKARSSVDVVQGSGFGNFYDEPAREIRPVLQPRTQQLKPRSLASSETGNIESKVYPGTVGEFANRLLST